MCFLMGLDESYSQIRGQILVMEPTPPINKVFSLILQEEKQRVVGNQHSSASGQAVFAVKTSKNPGDKKKQDKKDRPLCSHCGILGHLVDKCYKLHGYPPGYGKGKSKPAAHCVTDSSTLADSVEMDSDMPMTQAQYQHLVSLLSAQSAKPVAEVSAFSNMVSAGIAFSACHIRSKLGHNSWIIDSGATSHIASSLDVFSSYVPVKDSFGTLPNKTTVPVHSVGVVIFSNSLTWSHVLYIPGFKVNMLSVPALLADSHRNILFTATSCLIQDSTTSRMTSKGELIGGLYVLQQFFPTTSDVVSQVSLVNNVSARRQ